MRFDYEVSRIARGVTPRVNNITSRHAEYNDLLLNSLQSPEGSTTILLVDPISGNRQFILGVDSLGDANVRIGYAP